MPLNDDREILENDRDNQDREEEEDELEEDNETHAPSLTTAEVDDTFSGVNSALVDEEREIEEEYKELDDDSDDDIFGDVESSSFSHEDDDVEIMETPNSQLLENIDCDFTKHLDNCSPLEAVLSQTKLRQTFTLARKVRHLSEAAIPDFATWLLDAVENHSAAFNSWLWIIFNDFFGIFRSFVCRQSSSPDGIALNRLFLIYYKTLFTTRFLSLCSDTSTPSEELLGLVMRPVFTAINSVFKDAIVAMYSKDSSCSADVTRDLSVEGLNLEFNCFGGYAISSLINKEKRKLLRERLRSREEGNHGPYSFSSSKLVALMHMRELEKDLSRTRVAELPVYYSLINRGGYSIARTELKPIFSEILTYIVCNFDIDQHGDKALDIVKTGCLQTERNSSWSARFKTAFRSISAVVTETEGSPQYQAAEEDLSIIFNELLLKLIHGRGNAMIKKFKDLSFSRFYISKCNAHSGLREMLKQCKGKGNVYDLNECLERLFECQTFVTALNYMEHKLDNLTETSLKVLLLREPSTFDHNAIAVFSTDRSVKYGFIKKEDAELLAPMLDFQIQNLATYHGASLEATVLTGGLDKYFIDFYLVKMLTVTSFRSDSQQV